MEQNSASCQKIAPGLQGNFAYAKIGFVQFPLDAQFGDVHGIGQ